MAVRLHTPRLLLRPLRREDETLYCALYTDPGVMRHVVEPLAMAAARRAFDAVMRQLAAVPPRAHYWILAPRGAGVDLGLMALVPDRDDDTSAEVGVLLTDPAQCRGYATEAIAALADAFFAVPGRRRLWTRHARDNPAAVGLMRKLGFEPMQDAATGPAPVRWQMARRAWTAGRAPAHLASAGPNC